MGYRSNIKCLIYGSKEGVEAYILQTALITGSTIFKPSSHGGFKDIIKMYDTKYDEHDLHVISLNGESWKWYAEYEDVKAWEKFMYDSEENGLDYEFIRVGEEDDDIDVKRSDNHLYMLRVCTSIEADVSLEKEVPSVFIGSE